MPRTASTTASISKKRTDMEVYSYELFESITYKRKKIKEALHNGFVVFEYTPANCHKKEKKGGCLH